VIVDCFSLFHGKMTGAGFMKKWLAGAAFMEKWLVQQVVFQDHGS
jgi:hypothetical protein